MSKADEIRARAARATQRAKADPIEEQGAESTIQPVIAPRLAVVRAKPVRITADLPPQVYRGLIDYAAGVATTQGRARVAHVHVIRALVAELLEDENLQAVISRRVAAQLEA